MSFDVGRNWRPDGQLHYRRDPVTGKRIGVLPATCKRGEHSLDRVGYRATEREDHLVIQCAACAAAPHPDHSWCLVTSAPTPDSAELDDEPYAAITPLFTVRPTTLSR